MSIKIIKSLNEWMPSYPSYSCPDIDKAINYIKSIEENDENLDYKIGMAVDYMEAVRDINEELRNSLKDAVDYIEMLDDMVLDLQNELEELTN